MLSTHIIVYTIYLAAFVYSIILHEIAHAWVAKECGDPTAEAAGRITLNPIPHIDPIMSIALPAIMLYTGQPLIGGAKPVPVNPYNFRHLERDDLKVSLAGVAVNFLIALVFGFMLHLFEPGTINYTLFGSIAVLNIVLGIFNLIPIPPLDGSHVMRLLLSRIDPGIAAAYERIGFFGLVIIVLLLQANLLHLSGAIEFVWHRVFLIDNASWQDVMYLLRHST